MSTKARFGSQDYDSQWALLGDFIRYNPGARHRRRLVRNAVERLAVDRDRLDILDVGCGPGELYLTLRELQTPIRYHGLDLSAAAIQSARKHHADARWTVHDLFDGALDEQHDIVICSEVTEHVSDPALAIETIAAMTRPGGHLVLTTPSGKIHRTERAVGHVHHPEPQELRRWLRNAGFEVQEIHQWGWPAYTALKYAGDLAPGAVIDHLGDGTYGRFARLTNSVAYGVTAVGSFPTSLWGPQFVTVSRRS